MSVSQEGNKSYVLIGAPRYQSKFYDHVESGAVFRCEWNETVSLNKVDCSEINVRNDNDRGTNKMLLGFSISINSSNTFVSCAPAWVNASKTLVGKCYNFDGRGQFLNSFIPKVSDNNQMAGFSLTFINSGQELLLGAPGYESFIGAIITRNLLNNGQSLVFEPSLTTDSYLGYSITNYPSGKNIVVSAPRNNQSDGKVYVIPSIPTNEIFNTKNWTTISSENNAQGEYFGASLLALDINNDKIDDLIIGAPYYSSEGSREIGRIYVYINDKSFENKTYINGKKIQSRFGTSLSSIDINLDGFQDAIVGAPFEQNSDGSSGALYIFLGSKQGLNSDPYKRIGAESVKTASLLKGFGISIVSNTDFDSNEYNDILVGSFISEHAVLIRNKPIAELSTTITFNPSKIHLDEKNCDNNQSTCISVNYCVEYNGKNISKEQPAFITLEITDKLSNKENRVRINKDKNLEQKNVELKANGNNCFNGSFVLTVNRLENLFDFTTPIEVKLSVELKNQTSKGFCKDCPYAQRNSTNYTIEFEHGCQTAKCTSNLTLTAVPKYGGERIENILTEGPYETIDIDITVSNTGEVSFNTLLNIKMKPFLLDLKNRSEAHRCKADTNSSSYKCDVSKILQTEKKENLNLHFIVPRIPTNNLEIDFQLNSSSDIQTGNKSRQFMKFEIIKNANLQISGESAKNSYFDGTPKVLFSVSYILNKTGPSTINNASLEILLPTDIIELENESEQICKNKSLYYKIGSFPIIDKTMVLSCEKQSEYCTKYLCRLPKFKSGSESPILTLAAALIPSKLKAKEYNGIDLKINSELKIEDYIKFKPEITSSESVVIHFAIIDEKIKPWILFLSAGFGIFILIITVIILIKYGFFRRKKREQLVLAKQRMSMKPDSYEDLDLDIDTNESN